MILRHKLEVLAPLIALVAALGFVAGCGGRRQLVLRQRHRRERRRRRQLTIVGYSVAREVYADLIPAFQATPAGDGVTFKESYAASGEQSRAVEAGLDADYVAFSLEPDMTRLVDAGLVDPDWNAGPNKGFVSDSVVVFITRKGNPKGIKTWDDLTKDGVAGHHPEPVHLGRRAVEHHRRPTAAADRAGQDPRPGPAVHRRAVQERARAAGQRPRGPRRSSTPARATSSSPTRTRPSPPRPPARTSTTPSPTRRS